MRENCVLYMLQVIDEGHLQGLVARHQCCWGGTWYTMLEEEEMKTTLGNLLSFLYMVAKPSYF